MKSSCFFSKIGFSSSIEMHSFSLDLATDDLFAISIIMPTFFCLPKGTNTLEPILGFVEFFLFN
tara:strand:+ start:1201 stop:1392 length:192 start_codon:yes stop_codon:yes gene_type:complete